jgi:hypothetical protein
VGVTCLFTGEFHSEGEFAEIEFDLSGEVRIELRIRMENII